MIDSNEIALTVAVCIIVLIGLWWMWKLAGDLVRRLVDDPPETMLEHYRAMYFAGEIDLWEFEQEVGRLLKEGIEGDPYGKLKEVRSKVKTVGEKYSIVLPTNINRGSRDSRGVVEPTQRYQKNQKTPGDYIIDTDRSDPMCYKQRESQVWICSGGLVPPVDCHPLLIGVSVVDDPDFDDPLKKCVVWRYSNGMAAKTTFVRGTNIDPQTGQTWGIDL